MENIEWNNGKRKFDEPSSRGKLKALKGLMGSLLPKQRQALRTSCCIAYTSEEDRRNLAVVKLDLEAQRAHAHEIHRHAMIR